MYRPMQCLFLLCFSANLAHAADLEVKDAWVRGTVPGQQASGAFMTLLSPGGATLIGASSAAAATAEIHEMKTEGNIMKMRAVPRLELPPGKETALTGDHHIMLMGLKKPLQKGDVVVIKLKLQTAAKRTETVTVKAPVRDLAATGHEHHGHHHH